MTDTAGTYTPSPDYGLMRQQASSVWQNTLAQSQARRRQLLDQSGYHYNLDPSGNIQLGGLDVGNQFGQVQQLLTQQGQDIQDNNNVQAQRGIGQYGMAAQRDRLIRLGHQNQLQQQTVGLQNNLGDLSQQQQAGQSDYNNQLAGINSQQAQYQAGLAQYQAQTAASQSASQNNSNLIGQLLAVLQGGGA